MKAFKGFNPDLTCRGFQYEEGKTYELDGEPKLCNRGFHACENPLDIFSYYPPTSPIHEVNLEGVSEERDGNDTKVAAKKITIGARISLSNLTKIAVDFIFSKIDWKNAKESNTGDRSAATNTGDYSATTNTGNRSAATNTGNRSAATNTGYQSAATNTGDYSAATNTGDRSAATNTGNRSAATNTGYQSAATNTGDYSAAEVSGKDSVAIATGYESKVCGKKGCSIVCVERGKWNGSSRPIIAIKSGIVDGEVLKEDVWYTVKNGEWVEVK